MKTLSSADLLARSLRGFFTEYLPGVRGAATHTILSYRDAWALFLRFLAAHLGRDVVDLSLDDINPAGVVAFLDHLEKERGNRPVTRNARLAAIHTFAKYLASRCPEHLEDCRRLLSVPFKRARTRVIEYLEIDEIQALIQAIDVQTAAGRRDRALLAILFNTGARVQEVLDLCPVHLRLEQPHQARLFGKGRKERICPLWPETAELLRDLIGEIGLEVRSTERLFRNRRGQPLTRFGVRYILRKHAETAQERAPSLADKRIHPHMLRHTTAVHLLQSGVDLVTISHWLGHAGVETTNRYVSVDLEAKRAAIAHLAPLSQQDSITMQWQKDGSILDWLEGL